jgi:hypothetical protein
MLFRWVLALASLTAWASFCRELPAQGPAIDALRTRVLGDRIAALGPKVRRDEARRVAECAYATAELLRHKYGAVWPPLFQNFLVNTGIRKRGLCFQWAEDLLEQLDALKVTTLELHWAEARPGTWREHNCVVVTAKGQPIRDGILLDCWRHSGHLFWSVVSADHYPWVEDSEYAAIARTKSVEQRKSQPAQEQSTSASGKRSRITASMR